MAQQAERTAQLMRAFYGENAFITMVSLHSNATDQKVYTSSCYRFESQEEHDEYQQLYKNAKIGHETTGEQKNASERIYKFICMKRRMKKRMINKKQ